MLGYAFKRQRPISRYIVDFVCLSLKLIIEVDGYSHYSQAAKARDLERDQNLEKLGFTTLRFSGRLVLTNINVVRIVIRNWIEENSPAFQAPPRGGGK